MSGSAKQTTWTVAPISPAAGAVVAIAFVLLAILATAAHSLLLSFDEPARSAMLGLGDSTTVSVMEAVSWAGSRSILLPLTLASSVYLWRRSRPLAVVLLATAVVALVAGLLVKVVVDRPRPVDLGFFGSSFPSGHVVAAVAWWGLVPALLYVITRRRWVWRTAMAIVVVIVLAVGASRVLLSAHWPSDIVGGILLGVVFLVSAEWALRRDWLHSPSGSRGE